MAQVARPIAETDGGALNGLDFSTDEFALTHYTLLHDRERREPPAPVLYIIRARSVWIYPTKT